MITTWEGTMLDKFAKFWKWLTKPIVTGPVEVSFIRLPDLLPPGNYCVKSGGVIVRLPGVFSGEIMNNGGVVFHDPKGILAHFKNYEYIQRVE
jgi:hypothetical protein